MLGVRREGETQAAGNLQRAGLIRYSRGHIEVLDRPGLEKTVCECYAVVKLEFDRLLSDIPHGDAFRPLGRSGSLYCYNTVSAVPRRRCLLNRRALLGVAHSAQRLLYYRPPSDVPTTRTQLRNRVAMCDTDRTRPARASKLCVAESIPVPSAARRTPVFPRHA